MSEVKFFSDEPIDVSLVESTFVNSFGVDFDKDYWKWRFLDNPCADKTYIAYIKEGDTLAAYYAVSPVTFEINGESHQMALSNMTMTHTDHRGKGYFKLLAKSLYKKLKDDGFLGVFGFANHNSHYGFRKHLGWVDLAALNMFSVERTAFRYRETCDELSYKINDLDKEITSEIEKLSVSTGRVNGTRSSEFLNWRLINNPSQVYQALICKNDKDIQSITIFKKYEDSFDVMEHFSITQELYIDSLLMGIKKLLKNDGASVNIWSNLHSDEHLMLEKFGFQEKAFNSYFGVVPFTDNKEVLNYSNWKYRFIDSDIF